MAPRHEIRFKLFTYLALELAHFCFSYSGCDLHLPTSTKHTCKNNKSQKYLAKYVKISATIISALKMFTAFTVLFFERTMLLIPFAFFFSRIHPRADAHHLHVLSSTQRTPRLLHRPIATILHHSTNGRSTRTPTPK